VTSNIDIKVLDQLSPGCRVKMMDLKGVESFGTLIVVRGNPNEPTDPVRDALIFLDDPNTEDPWGPVDLTEDYWSSLRATIEEIIGRKITSKDQLAAPDILETLPEEIWHTAFIWVKEVINESN
jgi:hypothetical protein